MPYVALNNAASTLSGGLTSIATAISVQVGHGAKFAVGANYSYLTLQDASSNIEIVKLTSVTGDVLNVVRAQDGTAARTWAIGDTIGCRPCAAGFNDFAVGPQITNSTSKVTPVDADELGVTDSAASFGLKKLTWANLKSTLVTYFNTLFTKVDGSNATGTWNISTSGNAATGVNADITSMTALTAINRTGGTAIKGTNTNDSAAAGYVGEYVSSVVPLASALSISNGPILNITNISLTAGDWDISGIVQFQPAASTSVTSLAGSINTTSATFNPDVEFIHRTAAFVPGENMGYSLPPTRMSFAVTTTVYLVAVANFTVSTMTAYGRIDARRVR